MKFTLLLIVVGGVVFGYWIVSLLFKNKSAPVDAARQARPDSESQGRTHDTPPPAPSAPPNARWYQVLAVSPSASPDEIRAAYRQLMSQYHPDKVSALGIELQALAERKTKEINAAYREGMNASGISV